MRTLREIFNWLFDRLPRSVAKKLETFPESGMNHSIVAVKTKEGRVVRRVGIGEGLFGIGHFAALLDNPAAKLPFRFRDVVDIEWEGYRVGNQVQRPEHFKPEWRFKRGDGSVSGENRMHSA